MHKKSSIEAVFIYVISSVVVVLILYFGYSGISSIYRTSEQNALDTMKLQMKADFSQLALRYETVRIFQYKLPSKFSHLCFADLFVSEENKTLRDLEIEPYLLINDSIASNLPNNVFLTGEATEMFDVGKLRLSCSPFFTCFKAKAGKVTVQAMGRGTYVLIANESGFCES